MDQLKPCPFCGGEVAIALTGCSGIAHWIITRGRKENACRCRVFMESKRFIVELNGSFDGSKEREELIERWNRREPTNNILQRLEDLTNTSFHDMERAAYIRAIHVVKTGGKE